MTVPSASMAISALPTPVRQLEVAGETGDGPFRAIDRELQSWRGIERRSWAGTSRERGWYRSGFSQHGPLKSRMVKN